MTEAELQEKIDRGVKNAMKRVGRIAVTQLQKQSRGHFSLQSLRHDLDHPYARRHGVPPQFLINIFNTHEGRIEEGWQSEIDNWNLIVTNKSELYTRFLKDGTKKMFGRENIEKYVEIRMLQMREEIIEDEIMKELNRG